MDNKGQKIDPYEKNELKLRPSKPERIVPPIDENTYPYDLTDNQEQRKHGDYSSKRLCWAGKHRN